MSDVAPMSVRLWIWLLAHPRVLRGYLRTTRAYAVLRHGDEHERHVAPIAIDAVRPFVVVEGNGEPPSTPGLETHEGQAQD